MRIRDDSGFKELGVAIVRQAIIDFDDASKYLARSTSKEQQSRVMRNCKGHLSTKEARVLYKENWCRSAIKDVTKFLKSDWCVLCIDGFDGDYYLKQLLYRDWRRQCIANGISVPRGNEFVPRKDFTEAESERYDKRHKWDKNFRGCYIHRDDVEIEKWFNSLSDKDLLQMSKTRSFDAETFYEVFGIKPRREE